LIENISLTSSELTENLKKEKEAMEKKRTEIFDSVNLLIDKHILNFTKYEKKAEIFSEILSKKKMILSEKERIKFNYSKSVIEETKIFKDLTEEYLYLILKFESTKVLLDDILSDFLDRAKINQENGSQVSNQDYICNLPFSLPLSQTQYLSQDNLKNKLCSLKLSQKSEVNIKEKKKDEFPNVIEDPELEISNFLAPYKEVNFADDYFLKVNSKNQNVVIKNKEFSKKIRENFLETNYHDFLFNPKYEDIWQSIPEEVYKSFAKELKYFAKEKGYEKWIKVSVSKIEYFLKNQVRGRYTRKYSIDYISPDGEPKSEIHKNAHIKSWIKVKYVANEEHAPKLKKQFGKIKCLFNYYFTKKYDHNTIIIYGEIRSYFRFINYSFWNAALKNKFDYISMKSFQHEEDLMKYYLEDFGFQHNLKESFIEDFRERVRQLDDMRREYARIVLNYLVILL
jgi:hypothetical protein